MSQGMARIRTIKPEFWDDQKLAEMGPEVQLLYIGTWNFSDDYGVVKGDPRWLRNKIFPYGSISQQKFDCYLHSLVTLHRLFQFEANGETFLYNPKFIEHQVINKPSKGRNPEPPQELIDTIPTLLPECYGNSVPGKGREGKGKERKGKDMPSAKADSPYRAASDFWVKEYKDKIGIEYRFQKKDGVALAALLKVVDLDEFKRLATWIIKTEEKWYCDNRTPAILNSKLNEIRIIAEKRPNGYEIPKVPI